MKCWYSWSWSQVGCFLYWRLCWFQNWTSRHTVPRTLTPTQYADLEPTCTMYRNRLLDQDHSLSISDNFLRITKSFFPFQNHPSLFFEAWRANKAKRINVLLSRGILLFIRELFLLHLVLFCVTANYRFYMPYLIDAILAQKHIMETWLIQLVEFGELTGFTCGNHPRSLLWLTCTFSSIFFFIKMNQWISQKKYTQGTTYYSK